jgi:serine/threonine protein phosphatase PrpC
LPKKTTRSKKTSKSTLYFHHAGLTHVGLLRGHNEDAYQLPVNIDADTLAKKGYFYVLADGMGGHEKGEVASAVTIETTTAEYYATIAPLDGDNPQKAIIEAMTAAIEKANLQVLEATEGGGTTIVAATLYEDLLVMMNVGDSRAYLLRNGELRLISRDHSLVSRLRELGKITEEEALNHPRQNVLYQALGQGSDLEIHVYTDRLQTGDMIILCSDGLWGPVGNPTLQEVLNFTKSPCRAAQQLIDLANASGGPDNITAIVVGVSDQAVLPEDETQPELRQPCSDDTHPVRPIKVLPTPDEVMATPADAPEHSLKARWRSVKTVWLAASLILLAAIGGIVYYSAL